MRDYLLMLAVAICGLAVVIGLTYMPAIVFVVAAGLALAWAIAYLAHRALLRP
jgi:hypothetical protein